MTQSDPHRRQFLRRTGASLTVLGTGGLVSTSATAQSDTQQGILADGFQAEPDHSAFFMGVTDSFGSWLSGYEQPEKLASRMQNEFNANTDAWLRYGNWLLEEAGVSAAGSATVAVDIGVSMIPLRDPETVVDTHIDAEYDDGAGEFVDLEWVDGAPDEPDFEVGLRNQAAQDGSDELAEFRKTYMGDSESDHEIPDNEYLNRLAGKYSTSLRAGENSMTVLDVLLGQSL